MQASGASNLKRVTMELGGKSPLVVCEDCGDCKYLGMLPPFNVSLIPAKPFSSFTKLILINQ